ncbi:MAG: bifunctional metallophosphatase/5'-nucleotidase [Deltaproteobacteria bacterium]|nr:bifunctional metallophosphatase/5'-nucleotidase [Deltaproteobacteria bacterium]
MNENAEKSEDVILAEQVGEIDIIISGHSHTRLAQPIVVGQTIIVQTGAYGRNVGVLDVTVEGGAARLKKYKLVKIDDQIKGAERVNVLIDSFVNIVNRRILAEAGLSFFQTVSETDFDLTIKEEESNLGNLVTDSIRWYINRVESEKKSSLPRVDVAVESNGLIRSSVLKGRTGNIAVCDLFRAVPLGVGFDSGSMTYPLVTFYVYGSELKKALEILTSVYTIKGDDYYLQISGLKFKYNPLRMLFDRVTDIWIEQENGQYRPLDYSKSNKRLYRVAANMYNSAFLEIVGDFTFGILNIQPKDENGRIITDLTNARVDANQEKEGIQELKEWQGVMAYVRSFKDIDGNGVSDIPVKYKGMQGRIVKEASLNPVSLLVRSTYVTWTVLAVIIVVLVLLGLVVYIVVRLITRGGARSGRAG